jgi:GT2 family glycosyltransferase
MTTDSETSSGRPGWPSIDVVICTKDRPSDLERALRALVAQMDLPDHLIVVDASAAPGTLPPLPFRVTLLRSDPGLPRQRNAALAVLSSELVAFLDDDAELQPPYLRAVRNWFSQRPGCAGVSGYIVNDPVTRPAASRVFRRLFSLGNDDGLLKPSGDATYLRHPRRPTRVHFLSGSNMVFRRKVLDGLKFDETLTGYAYMEDVDFSLRVSPQGEFWMLPDARLIHHVTPLTRVPRREYVRQVFANGAYLFAKHECGRDLRRSAFARRLVGRATGYLVLSALHRSPGIALGMVEGLREVPAMLRRGKAHGN